MSAVGDARKRHSEQHHTHHDAATRELIARAEARGAERERDRIAQAIIHYANERLLPRGEEVALMLAARIARTPEATR